MATSGCTVLLYALILLMVMPTSGAVSSNTTRNIIDGETRLFRFLLDDSGYEKHVRPGGINRTRVHVNISMSLIRIVDVLEKEETLITNMWLQMYWTDARLAWDPGEFDDVQEIRLPYSHIWKPDVVLYNNADDQYSLQLSLDTVVYSSGSVNWIPPTIFRSHCSMDMSWFPFDTQICSLKLGSWTYSGNEVSLSHYGNYKDVDLSEYKSNQEWSLTNSSARINVVKYVCCPEEYQDYFVTLTLRRRPGSFIYMFISPSVVLSLLTPFLFLIPPSSGERTTLGALLITCLVIMLQTLNEYLPPQHLTTPIIGVYYTGVMVFASVALALSAFVINMSSRGSRLNGVPNILRKIFLGPMKKLVFVDEDNFRPFSNLDMSGKREAHEGTVHPSDTPVNPRLEAGIEELVREMRAFNQIRERQQIIHNVVADWQELILVLDRVFFVVFMVTICIVTMAMLI